MRFYGFPVAAAATFFMVFNSQQWALADDSNFSSAQSVRSEVSDSKNEAPPLIEQFLLNGNIKEGKQSVVKALSSHPQDDQLRFSLGVVQVIRTMEQFSQDICFYGLRQTSKEGLETPFITIAVPPNRKANSISHQKFQQVIQRVVSGFEDADRTLSKITDENVHLRLHVGLVKLDLDGDGHCGEREMLWRIYQEFHHNPGIVSSNANSFVINFDRGDVHWLRGYLNLITSFLDMYLAYDTRETFYFVAPALFEKVDDLPTYFTDHKTVYPIESTIFDAADLIAGLHSVHWNVEDRTYLEKALIKLDTVISESRTSWKFILEETDDDCEWLPNPRQKAAIPGMAVDDDMVHTWSALMDELERILHGELLVPFWRGKNTGLGINIRRLFLEPTSFDPILWVQGRAMTPYLEKGRLAKSDIWKRMERVFGDQAIDFAVWFN